MVVGAVSSSEQMRVKNDGAVGWVRDARDCCAMRAMQFFIFADAIDYTGDVGRSAPSDGFGLLWGRQRRTGRTEKARVAVAAR